MKIQTVIGKQSYEVDLSKGQKISIQIQESGNPNCYHTDPLKIEPVRSGNFVGSLQDGSPVNHKQITIAPHGNGTHTECSGHIFDNGLTIGDILNEFHLPALLLSVEPETSDNNSYITEDQVDLSTMNSDVRALVIRTLPNDSAKLSKNYSGSNPTYLSESLMAKIVDHNIQHLIVDLPSVDPEVDNGLLKAHRNFWKDQLREKSCTITELAYVPNSISDGLYLLNLQVLNIGLDVSPSNPVLYSLKPI